MCEGCSSQGNEPEGWFTQHIMRWHWTVLGFVPGYLASIHCFTATFVVGLPRASTASRIIWRTGGVPLMVGSVLFRHGVGASTRPFRGQSSASR